MTVTGPIWAFELLLNALRGPTFADQAGDDGRIVTLTQSAIDDMMRARATRDRDLKIGQTP